MVTKVLNTEVSFKSPRNRILKNIYLLRSRKSFNVGHFYRTGGEGFVIWLEIVILGEICWNQHHLKSSWDNWVVLKRTVRCQLLLSPG